MSSPWPAASPPTAGRSAGEVRHYADFLAGPGSTGPAEDVRDGSDRPVLLVLGNCQAESLRLLLDADDVRTVRVPPLHDVRPHEVAVLHAWLGRADLVVAQPVSADYRGMPLGTEQLLALTRPATTIALVPIVRYTGLHPWHLVMHPPGLVDPLPPVTAYHDVRLIARAAWEREGRLAPPPSPASPRAVRAVADASVAELARRERRAGAVPVSDLLASPTAATMSTINHPGTPLLTAVAGRLRRSLDLDHRDPAVTRPLLTSVVAPLEAPVIEAHDLPDPARPDWSIDGARVAAEHVARAQFAWYAARPDALDLALERSEAVRALLGVAVPDRGDPAKRPPSRSTTA